jgi:hypothetical protein
MIQERFNKLSPHVKGLKIADDYNIVEVNLKSSWEIPSNEKLSHEKSNNGLFFFSDSLSFDEILDWLEEEVINHNLEIEEKEKLLATKVGELKEMFQNTSLDDLINLQFSTEKNVLKLTGDEKKSTQKSTQKIEK